MGKSAGGAIEKLMVSHATGARHGVPGGVGSGLCNCLPKKAFPGYPSAA